MNRVGRHTQAGTRDPAYLSDTAGEIRMGDGGVKKLVLVFNDNIN